jgi:hypothetical protein
MALTQVDQGLLSTNAQYTGFKNRIINGQMVINQRGSSSYTINTDPVYTLDRFSLGQGGNVNSFTVQQSTTVPTTGFRNSMLVTMGTGVTVAAGAYAYLRQAIEGYNVADFNLGSSTASPFTVSFYVRSSVTGTFGVSLRNGGSTATYCATYTINAASTWEYKTVTIPAITSGTWTTDNTAGLELYFDLGVGSTYSGTANQLNTGANYFGVTGTTKLAATTGATFYITGVQLEKGSTATSFDYRPYGTELALCQRYCQTWGGTATYERVAVGYGVSSTSAEVYIPRLTVAMRAAPSITYNSLSNFRASIGNASFTTTSIAISQAAPNNFGIQIGVATGLTLFQATSMDTNNTTAALLVVSAEL